MASAVTPRVQPPSEQGLGPAMLALDVPRRVYTWSRVVGGMSRKNAVLAAGFSDSTPDVIRNAGHRLEHDPEVQRAIEELSRSLMRSIGPKAVRVLAGIMLDKKAKHRDRIAAATELMDRAGLNPVSQSHVLVEHKLSESQLDQKILALAAELGLSRDEAQKMLIDPSKVVDAEWSEVPAELTPEQIAGQEQRDAENARRRELRAMTPEQRDASKAEAKAAATAAKKQRYADAQRARAVEAGQLDLEDAISERSELPTQQHVGHVVVDDLSDIFE